ncbi:MAG: hypothetical protein ACJ710_06020 [Ornithinibacter sp.]
MGIVDPAAGDWFPQQALELARLALPPLPREAGRRMPTLPKRVGATYQP